MGLEPDSYAPSGWSARAPATRKNARTAAMVDIEAFVFGRNAARLWGLPRLTAWQVETRHAPYIFVQTTLSKATILRYHGRVKLTKR